MNEKARALFDEVQRMWDALSDSDKSRYKTLGKTIAAVSANAVFGGMATKTKTRWYQSLKKPWFQPPAWLFPIAWTALYTDIAAMVGCTLADLEEQGREQELLVLRGALTTNLILNWGWCYIFFAKKRSGLGTIEAALLAASSADLVRRVGAVDSSRGKTLLPYAIWTAFATILTFGIWHKNRKNDAAEAARKLDD